MKTIKKWHLLLMTVIMITATIGFSASSAFATPPPAPPTPLTTGFTIWQAYGSTYTGTLGTYMDITPDGGNALPGWCVDQYNTITIGAHYDAQIYNYFGQWYPSFISDLPAKLTSNINWFAIAYILNHEVSGASMWEIQEAIWNFTPGGYLGHEGIPVDANITAMIDAANTYMAAHGGIYVPGPGEFSPVIFYVNDGTQLIFYQWLIPGSPIIPTPELPTAALLGIGLAGLGGFGWIQRRKYVRHSAFQHD